jgi:hypothetical protein
VVEQQPDEQDGGQVGAQQRLVRVGALAELSSRPARRWACESTGMTTSDSAASAMPTVDGAACSAPASARTDSTPT